MPDNNSSVQELARAIREGNERAFDELYHQYRQPSIKEAYFLLRDISAAEDVVHDTFAMLWQKRSTIDPEKNLLNLLITSLRNLCLQKLRREKVEEKYFNFLSNPTQEVGKNELENKELSLHLMQAMDSINFSADLNAFKLHYIHGKSQKAIAEETHVTVQVVRNRVSRALKQLRGKLGIIYK